MRLLFTYSMVEASGAKAAICAAIIAFCVWLPSSPALACGQPISVEDIQHGVMPSEENLPCRNGPTPSAASPRHSPPQFAKPSRPLDQKQLLLANASMRVAEEALAKQDYDRAAFSYNMAIDLFRRAGDLANANVAVRKYNQAHCEWLLQYYSSRPSSLVQLQKDGMCKAYASRIAKMVPEAKAREAAENEARKRDEAAREAAVAAKPHLTDQQISKSMADSFSKYGLSPPKAAADVPANPNAPTAPTGANAQPPAAGSSDAAKKAAALSGDNPSAPLPPPKAPIQLVAKGMTIEPQKGANGGSASANSFNIPTPCQDLKGKYGCQNPGAITVRQAPAISSGQTQTYNRPKEWVPGGVAPDVQAEILALATSLLDLSDNNPTRVALKRRLERRLAEHHVALKAKDLACLQPTKSSGPRTVDIPVRWTFQQIKKEAIDRSGLCKEAGNASEAIELCRENKFGQAVMWAEPEIAALCRAGNTNQSIDEIGDCARRKFLNAASSGIVSAPIPVGWNISETCNAKSSIEERKVSLRDRLRAALAAARADREQENKKVDSNEAGQTKPSATEDAAPSPFVATDDDEAYCNYMARMDVRGELTPNAATAIPAKCSATIAAAEKLKLEQKANQKGVFSMDADETDAEIRRLVQSPPANSQLHP